MRGLAAKHRAETDPANIAQWISEHPECRRIASFAALPGEPDLLPLMGIFKDRDWQFPSVLGDSMRFRRVCHEAELQPGTFGILEPMTDCAEIDIRDIDLFLCPGMAFTPDGRRLGRGKGFYDRALAGSSPRSIRLGIAFRWQIVPDVFAEPHDIAMHQVILV